MPGLLVRSAVAICVASFSVAMSASAAPRVPAPAAVERSATLASSPLPRDHPQRSRVLPQTEALAAPGGEDAGEDAASGTVPATTMIAGIPLPRANPNRTRIIGRVTGGVAVPKTATAFAARNEGPVASLFEAAEAAAEGRVPDVAAQMTLAAVAPQTEPLAAPAERAPAAFSSKGRKPGSLKAALDALRADRYADAIQRRNGLKDPLDQMIVDYFLMRAYPKDLTFAMVKDFAARSKGWPEPEMVRSRAEAALARERPAPQRVIAELGGSAQSATGVRLLANAQLALGQRDKARANVRALWHNKPVGRSMQSALASDFKDLLTLDDHLLRVDLLVGKGRFDEAKGLRERLGAGPRAYVDALVAAAQGEGGAARKLKAVPAPLNKRPAFALVSAELKRRSDDFGHAARLIEEVPARKVQIGDAFWVETRIIARSLAERGKWRRAYKLAARGVAKAPKHRVDEEFHAGWFALVGLKDGKTAQRHFAELKKIATTPLSLSRGSYWLGRAAEASGNASAARRHFTDAAKHGFTYYGQLARIEIGSSGTGVARAPRPSNSDKRAFASNAVAEAVRRLMEAGHEHRIWPLMKHLAQTVPTPGQAALVAELGEKAGAPHLALMAAKASQRRGVDVGQLAYPTTAIPNSATIPAGLDKALVYAIARQESLFNPGAKSPVGAAGLMQVMPRTATSLARELGLKHSARRLTSDPAYNTTLGAAYLQKRLGNFDGSFIMTFAAYNAGAGRVREWVERFGDPRSPDVDPINWVEQIPFPETRNYVMRVMENVQVYREALGTGRLAITSDLRRGRRS